MREQIEPIKEKLENIIKICNKEKNFKDNNLISEEYWKIEEKYNSAECSNFFDEIEELAKRFIRESKNYNFLVKEIGELIAESEKVKVHYEGNKNGKIEDAAEGVYYWICMEMEYFIEDEEGDALIGYDCILKKYNSLKEVSEKALKECTKLLALI